MRLGDLAAFSCATRVLQAGSSAAEVDDTFILEDAPALGAIRRAEAATCNARA
jgi:hypothetical protein